MEETLTARNVATEFVEVVDETVHVGYRSHQTDTVDVFTELRLVVDTVLDAEPDAAVEGAVFHTEHPIIGFWHVDAAWAARHRVGDLSELGLAVRTLRTLRTVPFA